MFFNLLYQPDLGVHIWGPASTTADLRERLARYLSPPLSPVRVLAKMMGSRGIAFLVRHLPRMVPVEARFMINFSLQMLKDYHVLIFSPRLKEITRGRFPPILYDDQELLFRDAARLVGRDDPEAAVFHQGAVSYPVIAG